MYKPATVLLFVLHTVLHDIGIYINQTYKPATALLFVLYTVQHDIGMYINQTYLVVVEDGHRKKSSHIIWAQVPLSLFAAP